MGLVDYLKTTKPINVKFKIVHIFFVSVLTSFILCFVYQPLAVEHTVRFLTELQS